MDVSRRPPSHPAQSSQPSRATPQPRQPPPMREVTKGWFTMREEPKTVEQFRKAEHKQG